jgi:hypothetical protein
MSGPNAPQACNILPPPRGPEDAGCSPGTRIWLAIAQPAPMARIIVRTARALPQVHV